MYRVMPHDPGPDGTYRSAAGVSADDKVEAFEIVFKVPRLEVHANLSAHIWDCFQNFHGKLSHAFASVARTLCSSADVLTT
jgi:hypothetical protein